MRSMVKEHKKFIAAFLFITDQILLFESINRKNKLSSPDH